jgi:hypothetical protein
LWVSNNWRNKSSLVHMWLLLLLLSLILLLVLLILLLMLLVKKIRSESFWLLSVISNLSIDWFNCIWSSNNISLSNSSCLSLHLSHSFSSFTSSDNYNKNNDSNKNKENSSKKFIFIKFIFTIFLDTAIRIVIRCVNIMSSSQIILLFLNSLFVFSILTSRRIKLFVSRTMFSNNNVLWIRSINLNSGININWLYFFRFWDLRNNHSI